MIEEAMQKDLVLIVDDDPLFCKALGYQLQKRHYQCLQANTPEQALEHVANHPGLQAVILDYFLGSKTLDGLAVCRKISALGNTPVIMLTSNNDTQTIVSCLDAGAAQYIVKPCDIEELTARLRAVLRQSQARPNNQQHESATSSPIIQLGPLVLNLLERSMSCNSSTLSLTEKEIAVLEALMQKPGVPTSRNHLYRLVYGKSFDYESRAMDVLVGRVRRKIESLGCNISILAVRGEGYILQYNPHQTHCNGN